MKRITFHSRSSGDDSFDNVLAADFSEGNRCRLNLNGTDIFTFSGWERVTIEAGPAPPSTSAPEIGGSVEATGNPAPGGD